MSSHVCVLSVKVMFVPCSAGLAELLGCRCGHDNAVGARLHRALVKWGSSQFIPTLQLSVVSALPTGLSERMASYTFVVSFPSLIRCLSATIFRNFSTCVRNTGVAGQINTCPD